MSEDIKIETIETECSGCGCTAEVIIKLKDYSLELCKDCAKELYWALTHSYNL